MRNTVAKRLRREALANTPNPGRAKALYQKLKTAWVRAVDPAAGTPAKLVTRLRSPRRGFHRPLDLSQGPAIIESPLKFILRLFPGHTAANGSYTPDPTATLVRDYAAAGRGDVVTYLARRFA